jgi:hypothetical protein
MVNMVAIYQPIPFYQYSSWWLPWLFRWRDLLNNQKIVQHPHRSELLLKWSVWTPESPFDNYNNSNNPK